MRIRETPLACAFVRRPLAGLRTLESGLRIFGTCTARASADSRVLKPDSGFSEPAENTKVQILESRVQTGFSELVMCSINSVISSVIRKLFIDKYCGVRALRFWKGCCKQTFAEALKRPCFKY